MITNFTHLSRSATYAVLASVTVVSLLFVGFFLSEPTIGHGQTNSNEFYIRQTITSENSFLVQPSNVTMLGTVYGVTGGNATGSTQFVVVSNNASGYYVDISFEHNGTEEAMIGDVSSSESIRDYDGDDGLQPGYGWTASTAAQFAYTVSASSSGDIDASFKHNAVDTCGGGGSNTTPDLCWKAPTSSPYRIIDTIAPATTGATSSIKFKVSVPSGAVPSPTAETYTATATLTLTSK
ncbi:MAG: hypothetical protein KC877_00310 [Candidatus Kaiserbacteria bacterium]|nr:hypothetical protein [Candidatus Kaiserbacteria bacterium]MCB9816269.1 hypothetical protein [Candidatus Nomurabacteria bacterium]